MRSKAEKAENQGLPAVLKIAAALSAARRHAKARKNPERAVRHQNISSNHDVENESQPVFLPRRITRIYQNFEKAAALPVTPEARQSPKDPRKSGKS